MKVWKPVSPVDKKILEEQNWNKGDAVNTTTAFWAEYEMVAKVDDEGEKVLDKDGEEIMEKKYTTLGSNYESP